jgi:hypothetical protein
MGPALLLAACSLFVACGNYSNEDLLFLNALPPAEELKSRFPGLPDPDRKPDVAQAVGDPSVLADFTRDASARVNTNIDALLGTVERLSRESPSERARDGRRWGPWPEPVWPDFESQLVMEREELPQETVYRYRVESRRRDTSDPFVSILDGSTTPVDGDRKGSGQLFLRALAARDLGRPFELDPTLDHLAASYDNRSDPVQVQITAVAVAGSPSPNPTTSYGSQTRADGSGQLSFSQSHTLAGGVGLQVLNIDSRWLADGRGSGTAIVVGGPASGALWLQCWGADYRLVYQSQNWDGLIEGSPDQCPVFP